MSQPDLRAVQSTADYANGPDGTDLETALELMAEEYSLLERDAESLGIDMDEIDHDLAEISANADALLSGIAGLVTE
ncbi:hypothetical protein [Pseudomonas sp. SST3]|uniref:hypothetical protein n=1 Tax=Pseudomonas sp. SST3 TaxID=2267882 RepID=UPI000DFCADF3|nr:hypothetical protein [Pseudomonas sp. SST3]NKQ11508.1 hypothetical protein [Pseudomonas sp. SST3]